MMVSIVSTGGFRLQLKSFVLILLVSTFALCLHVELAKYDAHVTFPAKHIVHGDLQPRGKQPRQIFAIANNKVGLGLSVGILPPGKDAVHPFLSEPWSQHFDFAVPQFLNYLALFVRPPPRF
jgi:hypothetical protein